MTKKMFRKFLMISAVLFLLASIPANADESCEQYCQNWAATCMNDVIYDYFCCIHYGPGDPYCYYEVFEPGYNYCMDMLDMCLSWYCG